jgi:hypothetical protein
MINSLWSAAILIFLGLRVAALVHFWKSPFSFGADKFFGLPLPSEQAKPLLRRYRAQLFFIYVPDAICASAAFYSGGLLGVALEQIAASFVTRVYHTLLAIHTIRRAKSLAAGGTWMPVRSIALSLKTRRLSDYTNLAFELLIAVATIGSVSLLIYDYWQEPHRARFPGSFARTSTFVGLLIYLQLGSLLVKHTLVKWRMWLPGERTEVYLNWREEARRYFLWFCDYIRGMLTVGLVVFVLFTHSRTVGREWTIALFGPALAVSAVVIALFAFAKRQRRLRALWNELQPLEAFTSPPEPIIKSEFFLGGLCYYNAENPALFVPGPLAYAVNLANSRAYLYSAYFAGVAILLVCLARMPHS